MGGFSGSWHLVWSSPHLVKALCLFSGVIARRIENKEKKSGENYILACFIRGKTWEKTCLASWWKVNNSFMEHDFVRVGNAFERKKKLKQRRPFGHLVMRGWDIARHILRELLWKVQFKRDSEKHRKGVFGWVDFRENEKKKKKKKRRTFLVGIWFEGGEGKKMGGSRVFCPWAHQNVFSPKWGEN